MRRFVLLLSCFAAGPLAAGQAKLTGEAIKTTMSGSLLELDTPIGTTVAVRFGHDGMMTGDAGALASMLGAATDRGRWWVANDQLCYKWFRWFDAEARCLSIDQDAKHIFWQRDDGESGTATIAEQGKPIVKSATLIAQTQKPPAQVKRPLANVAVAAPAAEAVPILRTTAMPLGLASASPLHVPAPRPAVRPKPRVEVAVITVRPKFFSEPVSERKPFRVVNVEPSDVLNIRNGPSSDYDLVGVIPPNTAGITLTAPCLNDWCPVKHGGLVGWVNRRYLAEQSEPADPIPDQHYSELTP